MMVGTPAYVSPEQAAGEVNIDGKSDQYSLAIVYQEMLVGTLPFPGRTAAQLAKQHSRDPGSKDQGGELGFFKRGQMVPQFEDAAFKLKKGEVSEPFESQFGWHVVRVDDRRQRAAPPFEAVKDRVVATMIHQKAQQIAADLRGKAQIEYIDPEIKRSIESERPGARPKQ